MDAADFDELKREYAKNLPQLADVLSGGLSAKSAKVKKLLLSTAKDTYSLKNSVALYTTSEPLFVRAFRIYGPNALAIAKSIQIKFIRTDGTPAKAKSLIGNNSSAYAFVLINALIDRVELLALNKAVVEITKIEVTGYTAGQVEAIGEQLRLALAQRAGLDEYLAKVKAEVDEQSARAVTLEEETSKLIQERDSLVSGIAGYSQELERLSTEVARVSSGLESQLSANRDALGAKEQLDAELGKLNSVMGETRFQLRELVEHKRMISDEFSDFVIEGRGQARVYGWLSVVPSLAAAVAIGFLLKGAWNVTALVVKAPSEAYALFLQRLPYTAATILAVTLLLKVVDALVKKVMTIHEDRLGLAKLLVIARDTVFASANGLKLTDDEIFEQRLRLKMELLKVHLGDKVSSPLEESQTAAAGVDEVEKEA